MESMARFFVDTDNLNQSVAIITNYALTNCPLQNNQIF